MELLRRLLLLAFSFIAVSLLFETAPLLYVVTKPDFQKEFKRLAFPWDHKNETWEQYRDKEIKGRVVQVPMAELDRFNRVIYSEARGYLRPEELSVSSLVYQSDQQPQAMYITSSDAPGANLLRISRLAPHTHAYSLMPYKYKHPYSPWSILFLAAAIVSYLIIPRRKYSRNTLHYGIGFAAVVGPDIVGLLFAIGFFSLGLLVGLQGSAGGLNTIFDSNLIAPSVILWGFAGFGIYMMKIAADYADTGLECAKDHLVRYKPFGTESVAISEVACARYTQWKPSKWLIRLGFVISLLNWRALGPTLLTASRSDTQLEIILNDGRVWRYVLTGAENLPSIESCLIETGLLRTESPVV